MKKRGSNPFKLAVLVGVLLGSLLIFRTYTFYGFLQQHQWDLPVAQAETLLELLELRVRELGLGPAAVLNPILVELLAGRSGEVGWIRLSTRAGGVLGSAGDEIPDGETPVVTRNFLLTSRNHSRAGNRFG